MFLAGPAALLPAGSAPAQASNLDLRVADVFPVGHFIAEALITSLMGK